MSTALATVGSYAVLKRDPEEIRDIMKTNIGEGGVGAFDLHRVKVPAGGGLAWEIPTLDGPVMDKEIVGVIAAWRKPRAYWAESIDKSGGGSPPDCASQDGFHGLGNPGGVCKACPMAQFGSADRNGEPAAGQACKDTRLLFVVRPNELIPIVVVAPPTSIQAIQKYFLDLASGMVKFHDVVTSLGIGPGKAGSKYKYSTIVPRLVARLDETERQRMAMYADTIASLVDTASVQKNDVSE